MKQIIKRIAKKAAAALAIGAIGLTLSAPTPAVSTAEAGIGNAIGVAVSVGQMAAQRSAIKKEINEIETTDEGRRALFNEYQNKYGVNNDYALNQTVQSVMANLAKGVAVIDPTVNDQPYLWFINNDESVNAFCSLGHVMSINTGLFMKVSNEDEIAAVIGHEMGHGQKGHVKKGILKQVDTIIALNVGVAATGGSTLSSLAATIANIQVNAHSTKKNEWATKLL